MLIYLWFIYFNGYGKIKICIKKTNLLGLFSLSLLFFQFYNKISNWFPAVLNDAKICGVMKDDRGCCHGAGTGGKKAAYDGHTIEKSKHGGSGGT